MIVVLKKKYIYNFTHSESEKNYIQCENGKKKSHNRLHRTRFLLKSLGRAMEVILLKLPPVLNDAVGYQTASGGREGGGGSVKIGNSYVKVHSQGKKKKRCHPPIIC